MASRPRIRAAMLETTSAARWATASAASASWCAWSVAGARGSMVSVGMVVMVVMPKPCPIAGLRAIRPSVHLSAGRRPFDVGRVA
jgi:hypothetical protein